MSRGPRYHYEDAVETARRVSEVLAPVCERSKCVGSIRRRHRLVGDIEFVVEPRMVPVDLFGKMGPDVAVIRGACQSEGWTIKKGGERMLQFYGVGEWDMTLDLYLVHPPAQWGSIVAIRTGPWELGHEVMKALKRKGLQHRDGHVRNRKGEVLDTPEEQDLFRLAGIKYVEAERRDVLAKKLARK